MKNLRRNVIIAFAALAVAAVVYAVVMGNGAVTVAAPSDRPLQVVLDGHEVATLEPGEHRRINVEQGAHELTLESNGQRETHRLDVTSGTYDRMFPLSDQCFVLFDVTNLVFKREKLSQQLLPDGAIEGRFPGEPFDMPAGAKFSLAELPTDGERRSSELLLQTPCDALARDDAALIASAALPRSKP